MVQGGNSEQNVELEMKKKSGILTISGWKRNGQKHYTKWLQCVEHPEARVGCFYVYFLLVVLTLLHQNSLLSTICS